MKNLNFLINFGTKSANKGKIDIFSKKDNNYKLYFQIATNDININYFPEINNLRNNFRTFFKNFISTLQSQEFKPMKKPYDIKNADFIRFINYMNNSHNKNLARKFSYKRKMMVRDWFFYFYWCYKCKTSIFNTGANPIRIEFTRYYNIYCKKESFSNFDNVFEKQNKNENINNAEPPSWSPERPNPDNINLALSVEAKIKSFNFNMHPSSHLSNNDFISTKINNLSLKLYLNIEKVEFNFSIKGINLSLNNSHKGEKIIINTLSNKPKEDNIKLNYKLSYQTLCLLLP